MLLVSQRDRDLYYAIMGNPLDTHGGRFPHSEKQGFVVSLSDAPCDFSDPRTRNARLQSTCAVPK